MGFNHALNPSAMGPIYNKKKKASIFGRSFYQVLINFYINVLTIVDHPRLLSSSAAKNAKSNMLVNVVIISLCFFVNSSSGEWNRTTDLWVMSPTSYLCSTPQYIINIFVF
jgi:hypothetical protein